MWTGKVLQRMEAATGLTLYAQTNGSRQSEFAECVNWNNCTVSSQRKQIQYETSLNTSSM